ncbi:hypothetical protein MKEN_00536300 [Mycena kentingensis (nom. inval.)]|nr:hypothetical protein MKEN_00536300 [Mycena kentingensis (nom. inval.)]
MAQKPWIYQGTVEKNSSIGGQLGSWPYFRHLFSDKNDDSNLSYPILSFARRAPPMRISILLPVFAVFAFAAAESAGDLDARRIVLKANGQRCAKDAQCQSDYCDSGKCENKKAIGRSCSSNSGCISGICKGRKCAHGTKHNGQKCSAHVQCGSDYCGHSKCLPKAANGKWCDTDHGCKSDICKKHKCTAAPKPPTPPPCTTHTTTTASSTDTGSPSTGTDTPPATNPWPSGEGNYADFSSGTLGAWTGTPANKVTVVADTDSPGGYVARLVADNGETTSISRTATPPVTRRQTAGVYHLNVLFQFRVNAYAYTGADGEFVGGCTFRILVNGQNTGLQSIGSFSSPPTLNTWYRMSNGIITTDGTNFVSAYQIDAMCGADTTISTDIRNVTSTVERLA